MLFHFYVAQRVKTIFSLEGFMYYKVKSFAHVRKSKFFFEKYFVQIYKRVRTDKIEIKWKNFLSLTISY